MSNRQGVERIEQLLESIFELLRDRLPKQAERRPVDDRLPPWFERRATSGNGSAAQHPQAQG